MDNYSQLIERISRSANLEIEEIERKVEAKKAKLSGLISKEGAAQIVAAELGINLDNERLKISELVEGMKRANLVGKVIKVFPIREFNKNGREGKVANLLIADESSNTRAVLWDVNQIQLIESGKIKEGSVIEITGGAVRNAELHLSSFSELKESKEKLDKVVTEKQFGDIKLKDAKSGQNLKTRAIIVNTFEPKYFEVNPETGKKFTEEDKNNGLRPKKRALLNIVIDDGSETIRSVLFGDQITALGLTEEEIFSIEKFNEKKPELLGEEKIFTGQVRLNSFSNTDEFSIQNVEPVSPQELIKQLEAKTN